MKQLKVIPEQVIPEIRVCPFCLEEFQVKNDSFDKTEWYSHIRCCIEDRKGFVAPINSNELIKVVKDQDGDKWVIWIEDYSATGLDPLDDRVKKNIKASLKDNLEIIIGEQKQIEDLLKYLD